MISNELQVMDHQPQDTDSMAGSSGSESVYSEESHLLHRKKRDDDYDDPLLITEQADQKKSGFPKSIFFIVGNEFCERFSYYGMRTVLYLYFIDQLNLPPSQATIIYHAFTMLCYFTPIFGAMLADSLLGKFKTILYVSILYALGNIVLSMAATPPLNFPTLPISMLGLAMIALGTGGIKPCVSAFGGDQFDADQVRARERFFFIFYFAINAGSLISTYVTPLLRGSVQCFGSQTCFPLAFGVPAAIMVVSIILFVCGRPLYRIIPPQGNLVMKVVSCIGRAIKNKTRRGSAKRSHWLDHADDKFDSRFISDVRATLRVMYLFIPLPFFWALFDQQGSTWTLQATQMDGRLSSSYVIQPDQMQVVNPLLILFFIPVFDSGIYPLLARCGLLTRQLKRMFTGGMLAVLAFVVAAIIQIKIEQTLPTTPTSGHIGLSYLNIMPCNVQVMSVNPNINITVKSTKSLDMDLAIDQSSFVDFSVLPNCSSIKAQNFTLNVTSKSAYDIFLSNADTEITFLTSTQSRAKPKDGLGSIRLACNLASVSTGDYFQLRDGTNKYDYKVDSPVEFTDYRSVKASTYEVWHLSNVSSHSNTSLGKVNVENGGVYTLAVSEDSSTKNISTFLLFTDVYPNSVHMLWQVPQYVIITAGEIMFSITGLEFSYSQAPVSMKSVLTAAWLLTTAFGNLIVIIIQEIPAAKQSTMFFIYAAALFIVMTAFALMCRSYEYVTISEEVSAANDSKTPKSYGSDNSAHTSDENSSI